MADKFNLGKYLKDAIPLITVIVGLAGAWATFGLKIEANAAKDAWQDIEISATKAEDKMILDRLARIETKLDFLIDNKGMATISPQHTPIDNNSPITIASYGNLSSHTGD